MKRIWLIGWFHILQHSYGANIFEGTQYIGCYKDAPQRALSFFAGERKSILTIKLCIQMCKANNYTFAGAQYRRFCFCGESYDKYGSIDGCNEVCEGNTQQTCGGGYANSVYSVCPFGTFGTNCDKLCPLNCKKQPNTVCQFISGSCVYGCNSDQDGPYCDLPCKTLRGDPRLEVGNMNSPGGTPLNLFTTLNFPANSIVKGVQYYSQKRGRVYISFWRTDNTGTNKWTMVDKIEINSDGTVGPKEYLLKNKVINVQAEDAVAVHYKTGDPGAVIPYEISTSSRTLNIKDEYLHEVITANLQDDGNWQAGHQITYAAASDYKKTAAFKVLYNCTQEINCTAGKFGPTCSSVCPTNCYSNVCHRYTGECFNGCKFGKKGLYCDTDCDGNTYGRNCDQTCGHCHNSKQCDTSSGACLAGCQKGWGGAKCNTECKNGTYGENCSHLCNQNCMSSCERFDGLCNGGCKPGWIGRKCNQACVDGKYGLGCNQYCSGNCRGGDVCNKVTGYCDRGCQPGYNKINDQKCNIECGNNQFGYDCKNCSINCQSGCQKKTVNGDCFGGCEPGYRGLSCTNTCTPGKFGLNCERGCSNNCFNSCAPNTGNCIGGCKEGFHGHNCTKSCSLGSYGRNCSMRCSSNCQKEYICDHFVGHCTEGCKSGWSGHHCDEACTDGTYGENCSMICSPNCKYKKVCDQFSGVCLDGCKTGWTGQYCDKKCFELSGDPRSTLGPTNDDSSTSFTMFPDLQFISSGKIILLTFYAVREGLFYLDIWRKNPGKINYWMLVNKLEVNATRGLQVFAIPKDLDITVVKGDCFGIHYSTNDKGVIAFESNIADHRTPDIPEEDLHPIIYSDLYDANNAWKPRENFTHSQVRSDIRKSVALKILLNCKTVASKLEQPPGPEDGAKMNVIIIAVPVVIGVFVIVIVTVVSIFIWRRCNTENVKADAIQKGKHNKDHKNRNSAVKFDEVYEEIDNEKNSNIANESEKSYQEMKSYKPEKHQPYQTLTV